MYTHKTKEQNVKSKHWQTWKEKQKKKPNTSKIIVGESNTSFLIMDSLYRLVGK